MREDSRDTSIARRRTTGAIDKIVGLLGIEDIREADMQEISTRQRILFRAIVLVIILMVLAMFGLIRRHPAIVY